MPLVSSYKLLVFQHLSQDTKVKRKKRKKHKLSVVSVTQLYMLLCVMMMRLEGELKKKNRKQLKIKMCCVLCVRACVRRGEGKRFKDREDEMCDMR